MANSTERDGRLKLPPSNTPIEIGDAVVFFTEVKTLLTGFHDSVVNPDINRNWCYTGLKDIGYPDCVPPVIIP